MRGRGPKPVALKALAGNPGGRPLQRTGAPFVAGAPDKPDWLDEEAAAEWDRLIELLADESGVLSPAHAGILLITCEHFAAYRRADRFLREHGTTYETKGERSGGVLTREYPQVRQRHDALQAYRKCLNDLGATPTQGSRVQRLEQQELFKTGISRFFG